VEDAELVDMAVEGIGGRSHAGRCQGQLSSDRWAADDLAPAAVPQPAAVWCCGRVSGPRETSHDHEPTSASHRLSRQPLSPAPIEALKHGVDLLLALGSFEILQGLEPERFDGGGALKPPGPPLGERGAEDLDSPISDTGPGRPARNT
jgi:hypothetical protein